MIIYFSNNKGITLLLVVVILSALLSISVGVFNVVYGEILISGEIADSYRAFYAADRAVDKFLYLDRSPNNPNQVPQDGDSENTIFTVPDSSACYEVRIFKTPASILANCGVPAGVGVCIKSFGQFRCGVNPVRLVRRGFMVTY